MFSLCKRPCVRTQRRQSFEAAVPSSCSLALLAFKPPARCSPPSWPTQSLSPSRILDHVLSQLVVRDVQLLEKRAGHGSLHSSSERLQLQVGRKHPRHAPWRKALASRVALRSFLEPRARPCCSRRQMIPRLRGFALALLLSSPKGSSLAVGARAEAELLDGHYRPHGSGESKTPLDSETQEGLKASSKRSSLPRRTRGRRWGLSHSTCPETSPIMPGLHIAQRLQPRHI